MRGQHLYPNDTTAHARTMLSHKRAAHAPQKAHALAHTRDRRTHIASDTRATQHARTHTCTTHTSHAAGVSITEHSTECSDSAAGCTRTRYAQHRRRTHDVLRRSIPSTANSADAQNCWYTSDSATRYSSTVRAACTHAQTPDTQCLEAHRIHIRARNARIRRRH